MSASNQLGTPSVASYSVLLITAGISLALSIALYLEYRSISKVPRLVHRWIFDRTFNVFDPFAHPRKTYHGYVFFLLLSPLMAFAFTFIITFVILLQILQAGLILGLFLLVLCLNMMMIGEASEIFNNAHNLVKAAINQTAFGKGDATVFHLTKKSLRRLSIYYAVLTLLFSISFIGFPYMYALLLTAFAQFVAAITTLTLPTWFLAPVLISFLFALAGFSLFFTARKLRTFLFGFPPSGALTSAVGANVRRQLTYENLNKVLDYDPEEITW